ncbi:lipoprotein [Xanthomonas translucens]|nr:lipoprotein [Xanthomonas translucens]AVY67191.1 UDP-N-acetylglucosamine acyltransferase [Xanthomonas translucens pv. undulosa]MCT8281790.1 lipoprotein [Xanthomonas translucens pv. undulosa]QEN93616.1 UDP-N-acetylglucosamine acyltransferase [Xanthomonas translucens pv. undulosa]QSQ58355.1 UDP-N-acetylglucosamine acyltransferase [Xanthomonas translucens pv. undulosa]UKE38302.1 UDP-N-acetylglucosamine acyltransferase [Xanthomonas translucens pv. undulosa]
MRKTIWAALAAVALSGCASNPPLNFSVPGVAVSEKKLDAELRSMTVTLARPDEAKGKMPAVAQHEVAQMWQTALTEALNRAAIFRDDAPRKFNLSVKILAIDIPAFGASMTTKTIARYELIDRASGAVVYSRDVTALGTVPMNYAFMGVIRVRESLNRSAQDNIGQFLQDLKSAEFATEKTLN